MASLAVFASNRSAVPFGGVEDPEPRKANAPTTAEFEVLVVIEGAPTALVLVAVAPRQLSTGVAGSAPV